MTKAECAAGPGFEEKSFLLSSRRTGLSFQRTRLSADRTMMSVIRTAFSLIGFGFTSVQFFRYLRESAETSRLVPVEASRNFGAALVLLGVGLLVVGILYHVRFMIEIRTERKRMVAAGLVPGDDHMPVSLILVVATLLLILGLVAIVSIVARAGPLH